MPLKATTTPPIREKAFPKITSLARTVPYCTWLVLGFARAVLSARLHQERRPSDDGRMWAGQWCWSFLSSSALVPRCSAPWVWKTKSTV